MEVAHRIVEQAISKFGASESLVLYLDGHPCQEKAATQASREEHRSKAPARAEKQLGEFEARLQSGVRLRKHQFLDVQKNLTLGFHWTLEARRAFADYMRSQHWNVVECPTEADPMIATEFQHGDIVVTRDSAAFVYENIESDLEGPTTCISRS
ncbi:hypothetical protein BGZ65_000252 [Modicella reniformis]|uniref:Uncharacterized protein n=1 Tax=Modicella reniformis TaxID=1440133 RepID=A0A9P6MCG5_9FUNG|nr:hypothetical protein BGZ65_000252 [Modicella reniformis]